MSYDNMKANQNLNVATKMLHPIPVGNEREVFGMMNNLEWYRVADVMERAVDDIMARAPDRGLYGARRDSRGDNVAALLEAAASFQPPPELDERDAALTLLMGVIALKASTPGLIFRYRDVYDRYQLAADWVCENFGELIWWNCDRRPRPR